jgi:hypothetical protein
MQDEPVAAWRWLKEYLKLFKFIEKSPLYVGSVLQFYLKLISFNFFI